jgi:hypothetical protein
MKLRRTRNAPGRQDELLTAIATQDGTYRLRTVSALEARSFLAGRDIISAVGHESTAQALSKILDRDIPVNRIEFCQRAGQHALVFKLRGRPPEGTILSLSEIEAIGYDLKILDRLS